jgi:hypothetical protein
VAKVRVVVSMPGLAAFKTKTLEAASSSSGPLRDAWLQVAVRFRAFIQERFSIFSRGGGDWPPLAESTIKGRTRAPVTRALAAMKRGGNVTQAQYEKRLKAARAKAAKHFKKYQDGEARFGILINTGLLFAATSPMFIDAPGQYQLETPNGIVVGFGGPEGYANGGSATIADIASFHQEGTARLPQRKIIVPPPSVLMPELVEYLQRGVNRWING